MSAGRARSVVALAPAGGWPAGAGLFPPGVMTPGGACRSAHRSGGSMDTACAPANARGAGTVAS